MLALFVFVISTQVVVAQTEVVEETYVQGPYFASNDIVLIEDNVDGAVYAAGGTVTVAGNVTQDVVAAGGTIRISGVVDQDVYVAGGSVFIDGVVKGNVIAAGGDVQLGPDAEVGGSVMTAGERLGFAGKMMGPLFAGGRTIRLDGSVDRDVSVAGEDLQLGTDALIGGNLSGELNEWTGENVASVAGSTHLKKVEVKTAEKKYSLGGELAKAVFKFLWRGFVVVFTLFFVPQFIDKSVKQVQKQFPSVFMTGVVVVFGLPFLMVVLVLTILGIPIAILMLLAYIILLMLAWLIPSVWAGRKLLPGQNEYVQALLGVAVIIAVTMIPVVGALVKLVLAAFGVGALVVALKK